MSEEIETDVEKQGVDAESKEDDFVLGLEENALSSLIHGISHYLEYLEVPDDEEPDIKKEWVNGSVKFAIIHIFHSVELFLKARLAKAHPLLIYSKPEKKLDDNAYTVEFGSLLGRLNNVGVILTKEERDDLDALRKTRNSIEHHKIKKNLDEVTSFIARATRFLIKFLEEELSISLKDEIEGLGDFGPDMFKALSKAIYSYEERLKKAVEKMESCLPSVSSKDGYISHRLAFCPSCGEETIAPDPSDKNSICMCYFCEDEFYYEYCNRCSDIVLSYGPIDPDDFMPCRSCWKD